MSNNKEIAPGMFIDDSAGVFETDKFKQPDKAAIAEAEKAVEKAQYILNTTPPEAPADTQTVTTENPERSKKLGLVELCTQVAVVRTRLDDLSDAVEMLYDKDREGGFLLVAAQMGGKIVEIDIRPSVAQTVLVSLQAEAETALQNLLRQIATKDYA